MAPAISGTIAVAGQQVELNSPSDAIALGLALVPEDRKGQGLVLQMSVKENTSMASLKAHSINGIFRNAEFRRPDNFAPVDKFAPRG